MSTLNRRQLIAGLSAAALASASRPIWAQAAKPGKDKPTRLASKLYIVIPADPGGGGDQTG